MEYQIMTNNASKEAEKLQRKFFRQNVHRVWSMVKSGRRDELSKKDDNLAEILMDHEEYREMMAPEQYSAAKVEPESFLC